MKNFTQTLFLGMGLMAAMPVMAAVTSTGKTFKGNSPSFLNHNFCKDKQVRLVIEDVKDGEYNEEVAGYSILDSKLNVVSSFQVPDFPAVVEKKTVYEVMQGPIGIRVDYADDRIYWDEISLDEFIDRMPTMGFTRQEEINGELRFCAENPGEYYYFELFGYKYPTAYFYWKDNVGHYVHTDYGYDNWGPTGEYGEPRESENSYKPQPVGVYPKSAECVDLDDLVLTQTLFNDDDLYEYVIPVYETKSVSYENEYEKVEGTEVYTSGFKVMSQDGSVVAEAKFPSGYYSGTRDLDLDLYIMDGCNYIFAELRSEDDDEYVDVVYEINAQGASINMVGAPIRVRVTPTTPQRGTDVTVDLGAAAGNNCRVNVVSVSGRTVLSTLVEPGTERTTIKTGHLEQGMYVVTVSDGKSSRETAKIIVR